MKAARTETPCESRVPHAEWQLCGPRSVRVRFRRVGTQRETGTAGERAAEEFLRRRRYAIIARNYRCRGGEIDLVAIHRGSVVFVEVRTRAAGALVDPLETVDEGKRRRIVTAARHYVARHRLHEQPQRFDVVAVRVTPAGMQCEVVANAFDLDDLPPPQRRW